MNEEWNAGDLSRTVGARTQAPSAGDTEADQQAARQGLSAQTRTRIGTHLRAMYDTVVQQPVPDRFKDLIARLDADDAEPQPRVD